MARDKELEAERAKTRELECLLRLAEAEFLARPGNENVVRPCCSCGQTTHSSADCRRYLYFDRDTSPPSPRERWVESGDPNSGEKPRLVTAAVSGVCKRRPHRASGRLAGPRVTAKPFKLRLDTVRKIVALRRIFTPDQLTGPAKSVSLAEASRQGATTSLALLPTARGIVGGTSATQPSVAESAGQATGQACSTLAATASAGEVGAGLVRVGPVDADEPGIVEAPPLGATAIGTERGGQTSDAHFGASKALPYHDRACPNALLRAADATADVDGGKSPAGTAADGRVRAHAASATTRDQESHAIQLPSPQSCACCQAYPPGSHGFDKPFSRRTRGLRGPPDEFSGFGPPKRGSAASNVERLLLGGAVNQQGSQSGAGFKERASENNLARAGGNDSTRTRVNVSVPEPLLTVMRVALAVGATRTGCRGGSPDASANAKYRNWGNNQSVDSHLEAAPD